MSTPRLPSTGLYGLPEASQHPERSAHGTTEDPVAVLARLPIGTPDYLRVLGALLRIHNHRHASKHKGASFKTMIDRQRCLARFFRELRADTRFACVDPRQLANRHIEAMVARWKERGLSTATVHNYLSFLRTFAAWIGKPGMVREPAYYVGTDSPLAHRTQVATKDKSWSAHHIDIESKLSEIGQFDPWVGYQVRLCFEFGMRAKEARHFRPHGAVLSRELANPADAAAFPEAATFVRVSHGTKGGRPRDVPVVTDAQRALIAEIQRAVASGSFVGHPGLNAEQARSRFYYVIRKFGISKKDLGVVAHGLRHQHVNDGFEADTGCASPVRGGVLASEHHNHARNRVARVLGHNRLRVTNCYLGSISASRRAAALGQLSDDRQPLEVELPEAANDDHA